MLADEKQRRGAAMGDPWDGGGQPAGKMTPKQMRALKSFVSSVVNRLELAFALAPYVEEPPFAKKAARDLTQAEAFHLLLHLYVNQEIRIEESFRIGKDLKILYPTPGQQFRIGTRMGGLVYDHAGLTNGREFDGAYAAPYFTPTAAFAIVLYRFAKYLSGGRWGATSIVWGGIGHGSETKKGWGLQNCHEVGTCVDFYGARTGPAGAYDVLADWGNAPIYEQDGKLRPGRPRRGDKWGAARSTFFRLRNGSDRAAEFFGDVWTFLLAETSVTAADGPAPAYGSPMKLGKIMHPDYPDPRNRGGHQEHMHFQLGEAFFRRS